MNAKIAAEIIDYSNAIAQVKIRFKLLGLSWKSPRVQSWMSRAGFKNQYEMSVADYQSLCNAIDKACSSNKIDA